MSDRDLVAKITSCTNVVKQYRKIVAFCINFSHNDESMKKAGVRSENVRPPCLQHKIFSAADASTPQKHRAACALLRDLPFHQCHRSIPVKFIQIMLDNANKALLGAFAAGALLLGLVLLLPALEPLFSVAPLSGGMVGAIVGLAFGSMVIIQLLKLIRR